MTMRGGFKADSPTTPFARGSGRALLLCFFEHCFQRLEILAYFFRAFQCEVAAFALDHYVRYLAAPRVVNRSAMPEKSNMGSLH